MTEFTRICYPNDPAVREQVNAFGNDKWPEFMFHDPVADHNWHWLMGPFAAFQFAYLDASRRVVAFANCIPLAWEHPAEALDDAGWDWAFLKALADHSAGRTCNTVCALQVVVDPALRGTGLAQVALNGMKDAARTHGLTRMVAPVRPTHKSDYPLLPMDTYARWTRADGLPHDPWLRAHVRLGARVIKPCERSMTITGTPEQWNTWTGLNFSVSGDYVIPGALRPVRFDLAANCGTYLEPNVWMEHTLS